MRFSFFPVTALLLSALPACQSSDPGTLFVRGCLAIVDRAGCTFELSDVAPLQPKGTIDAAYAGEYTCSALVEGRGLSSPVQLFQAVVSIVDPAAGGAIVTQFTAPITGPVEPGVALGIASVTLIDAVTLEAEAKRVAATGRVQGVVSRFQVLGRTPDGAVIRSPPVELPIDITLASSCTSVASKTCIGGPPSAAPDCRLGIDEPAGTSCAVIAGMLGPCHTLECAVDTATGKSDLTTARCPTHAPPDDSCCHL